MFTNMGNVPARKSSSDIHSDTIILGLCAMERKVRSKPMKEILNRLERFTFISVLIFDEDTILNLDPEQWPVCDVLISFYSDGFPLDKAIAYAELRNPHLVNDLRCQYLLMNRAKIYQKLKKENIPIPRYALLKRQPDGSLEPDQSLTENDDVIEVNGEVFHKPFVEKPVDAENHDIYIYFQSSVGGGSQRLFRKVNNRSSKYCSVSHIRRDASYIYEEFMPTDGTDVKVYTVGDDYAHAEARKSPALDGKVERNKEGKEVRYPIILSQREKIIAKTVSQAFRQKICGFDLLRANGMTYVCDVNGFSFVKTSKKYYDDCGHILGLWITKMVSPLQTIKPTEEPDIINDDEPFVSTTRGTKLELRSVIGIIRHGDRTPKQKMKMEVRNEQFFQLYKKYAETRFGKEVKLKKPKEMQDCLDTVRSLLDSRKKADYVTDPELESKKNKLKQMRIVLELYGHFSGFNRKVQLKYQKGPVKNKQTSCDEFLFDKSDIILVIVKWGGELTKNGKEQAEELGKAFRCIYPGGDGSYGKDPGLGLLRLHSTYRHDLKIYASDEGRVQMTAAAFTKGFLALEGELPPILIQMVKSANTNCLLDSENDSCRQIKVVKKKIQDVMSKRTDFTEDDVQKFTNNSHGSTKVAMDFIKNPYKMLVRISRYLQMLTEHLTYMLENNRAESLPLLYHNETWDLLTRRWSKLLHDFALEDDKFDITKIADIYDNIKFDVKHNKSILHDKFEDLYICAKACADLIVPLEYGISSHEKLCIAKRIATPLLTKILTDIRSTDIMESTRLHGGYPTEVQSQNRFVRTRLYFTSESHLHALVNCLRYGELSIPGDDAQWARALQYMAAVPEINFLSQIVIMIYEDPNKSSDQEDRFHVELHFSPGVYSLCHDLPVGNGYRPHSTDLNQNENVYSSGQSSPIQFAFEEVDDVKNTLFSSTSNDNDAIANEFAQQTEEYTGKHMVNKFCVTSPKIVFTETRELPIDTRMKNLMSDQMGSRWNYHTHPIFQATFRNRQLSQCESTHSDNQEGQHNLLISTAVLSGSFTLPGVHSQGSNSPDTLGEIVVPSAPSVSNVYPLETLHNALTIRNLSNFLTRVTIPLAEDRLEDSLTCATNGVIRASYGSMTSICSAAQYELN